MIARICLLGFGEVGKVLAADLISVDGIQLVAHDQQLNDPTSLPSRSLQGFPGIDSIDQAERAALGCDLVISAVTAEEDLASAEAIAPGLSDGAWFLDLNSVSPGTKCQVASVIERAGGRYVEAALMSAIEPKRIAAPILLAGPHAESFTDLFQGLGFTGARFYSPNLGEAAATKMCRSVVVKGIEALVTESMLAARHYGVEDEVLGTLSNMLPNKHWPDLAHYLLSRSAEHGSRRAAEMREAAKTVREAGIEPLMSNACAKRQDWTSNYAGALEQAELKGMLDYILERLSLPIEEADKP